MRSSFKKLIRFPYKAFKEGDYPIIPIILKGPKGSRKMEAFVDSGASTSVFSSDLADKLGIRYRRGKISYTMVGDGGYITIYLNKVAVQLGQVKFRATVGFCEHPGAGINLIGQDGFFDRFDITFSRSRKIVTFKAV